MKIKRWNASRARPHGWLSLAAMAIVCGCYPATDMRYSADAPLAPCPPTPNCVSTEASDPEHAMPVIPFEDTPEAAFERARRAALEEPRTRIVGEAPGYLHLEARSRIFRFIDDVQIVIDESERVVRFRSASRVGRGDMGANRARMERFTRRFVGATTASHQDDSRSPVDG